MSFCALSEAKGMGINMNSSVTNHKKLFSLNVQIVLFVVILLAVSLSITGNYLYVRVTDALIQIEKERIINSTRSAGMLLQSIGENQSSVLKSNTHWELNRAAVEKKDIKWLEENINILVNVIPNLNFVATVDLNGNVLTASTDIQEFKGKLGYPGVLDRLKNESDFSGMVSTSKGLAMISVSKITDEEGKATPTGILVFGRLLDDNVLNGIKDTLQVDIGMLTLTDNVLVTSPSISKEMMKKHQPDIVMDNTMQRFELVKTSSDEVAQVITSFKDINNQTLGVLYVGQQLKASVEVKSEIKKINLIAGIVLAVIIILIAIFLHRRIIAPIKRMVTILGEVAKGKLIEQLPGSIVRRKDEIGQLSQSINMMIHNLQSLIAQIHRTTQKLVGSVQELSDHAGKTEQMSNEIGFSIQEVASGAEVQMQGANQSASAMKEMSEGIYRITETYSFISEVSHETASTAEKGNKTIDRTVQQMEVISESVRDSVAFVNVLGDRSKEIGQIVALVNHIATQTNLLALNAAIEAARAGEYGRGFAVVADEIRKLAEQTSLSTNEVTNLIASIQQDSNSTIQSMFKVSEEVETGLNLMFESGESFKRILNETQNVADRVVDVSAISQQMSASSEEVTASVEELRHIAEKSSDNSRNVVSVSRKQLTAIEEIFTLANTLNRMSQELQDQLSKFEIESALFK
jgi:methyl-accepting chemotaxis protein